MAYSDYGGYAYRNGERVEDRSDCTITPEGDTFGTPGMWPGFTKALIFGIESSATDWPDGHAVLGDGPIFLVLYKQTQFHIHRGFIEVDPVALLHPASQDIGAVRTFTAKDGAVSIYIDTDYFCDTEEPCRFLVDGCLIEIWWTQEDNFYQYARLTQPDGTVWTGWSGYGVGAGFEDGDYGYSNAAREEMLKQLLVT